MVIRMNLDLEDGTVTTLRDCVVWIETAVLCEWKWVLVAQNHMFYILALSLFKSWGQDSPLPLFE